MRLLKPPRQKAFASVMTVTAKKTGFSLCNVVAKAEPTETKSSTIGNQQHELCSKAGKTGKKSND